MLEPHGSGLHGSFGLTVSSSIVNYERIIVDDNSVMNVFWLRFLFNVLFYIFINYKYIIGQTGKTIIVMMKSLR